VRPEPQVICEPPSGSLFPIGQTTVTCHAVSGDGDGRGGASECSFTVTVIDRTLAPDHVPARSPRRGHDLGHEPAQAARVAARAQPARKRDHGDRDLPATRGDR
jgi:hypothetical protein